jgi:hypothetical protein
MRLSGLRAGRPLLPPGRFLALITIRGGVDPRATAQVDLPVCSTVPQPTTLQRATGNVTVTHQTEKFSTLYGIRMLTSVPERVLY